MGQTIFLIGDNEANVIAQANRAEASADRAESAALALLTGSATIYATPEDGVDETNGVADGETYAVATDEGGFFLYRNDAGTPELLVNFGTGLPAVRPTEFGAAGDGTTNDTAALQAALDTGNDVYLDAGRTFLFDANITLTANFQRLYGPGVLKPSGACGVVVSGGRVGNRVDVTVNSSTHTGTAVTVDDANRCHVRLLGVDVFNAIYVRKANTVSVEGWAACRGNGIEWYGDNSNRSDILNIHGFTCSIPTTKIGLIWDGNCHSLRVYSMGIVCGSSVSASNGGGMVIRNTSGGAAPAISRIFGLEIDYAGGSAINIADSLVTSDHEFHGCYVLGASASGLLIGNAVNGGEVRVVGGKFRGCGRYGIENKSAGQMLYDGMADLAANTLGETLGSLTIKPSRVSFAGNQYVGLDGSNNLLVVGDANDYFGFDTATNVWRWFVGGSEIFSATATSLAAAKPLVLPTYTVATLPAPALGMRAIVTDANATTFNSVVAGGGANVVPVFYEGSSWRIG